MHRFKVGQRVGLSSKDRGTGAARGAYKIIRLMPPLGIELQYHIKSTLGPEERVVRETELVLI